jgi:hypothetical protein
LVEGFLQVLRDHVIPDLLCTVQFSRAGISQAYLGLFGAGTSHRGWRESPSSQLEFLEGGVLHEAIEFTGKQIPKVRSYSIGYGRGCGFRMCHAYGLLRKKTAKLAAPLFVNPGDPFFVIKVRIFKIAPVRGQHLQKCAHILGSPPVWIKSLQGWLLVVKENRSVVGIVWVFQMISPTFKCHHRSESLKRALTVKTVRTTSRAQRTTGNENTRLEIRASSESAFRVLKV